MPLSAAAWQVEQARRLVEQQPGFAALELASEQGDSYWHPQQPTYDWSHPRPSYDPAPRPLSPPMSARSFAGSTSSTLDPSSSHCGVHLAPSPWSVDRPIVYAPFDSPPEERPSASTNARRETFILPPVVPYVPPPPLPPPSLSLLRDRHNHLYGKSSLSPSTSTYISPAQMHRPLPSPADDQWSHFEPTSRPQPYYPSSHLPQLGHRPLLTGRPLTRRPSAVRPPAPLALTIGPRYKLPPSVYDPPPSPGLLGALQTTVSPSSPRRTSLTSRSHAQQQRAHPYHLHPAALRPPPPARRVLSQSASQHEARRPPSLDSFLQSSNAGGPYVDRVAESESESESDSEDSSADDDPNAHRQHAPAPAPSPAVLTLAGKWTIPSIDSLLPEQRFAAGLSHNSLSPAELPAALPLHVSFQKGESDGKWSVVQARSAPASSQASSPQPEVKPKSTACSPVRKAKRQTVKNACVACKQAKKTCDDNRPCKRCVSFGPGRAGTCTDSARKSNKSQLAALVGVETAVRRSGRTTRSKLSSTAPSTVTDLSSDLDDKLDRSGTTFGVTLSKTGRSSYHSPSPAASIPTAASSSARPIEHYKPAIAYESADNAGFEGRRPQ